MSKRKSCPRVLVVYIVAVLLPRLLGTDSLMVSPKLVRDVLFHYSPGLH